VAGIGIGIGIGAGAGAGAGAVAVVVVVVDGADPATPGGAPEAGGGGEVLVLFIFFFSPFYLSYALLRVIWVVDEDGDGVGSCFPRVSVGDKFTPAQCLSGGWIGTMS